VPCDEGFWAQQCPAMKVSRAQQCPAMKVLRAQQCPAMKVPRAQQCPAKVLRAQQCPTMKASRAQQCPAMKVSSRLSSWSRRSWRASVFWQFRLVSELGLAFITCSAFPFSS
jgi:hypothetical protein